MNLKDFGVDEKDPRPVLVIAGNKDDTDIKAVLAKIARGGFEAYQIIVVDDIKKLNSDAPVRDEHPFGNEPRMFELIKTSATEYIDYSIPKKGKNSWKPDYKYHQ